MRFLVATPRAGLSQPKTGEYHIFCAEYCGTQHSHDDWPCGGNGPAHYEQWLKTGSATAVNTEETPEVAGARLFQEQRCMTCHHDQWDYGPSATGRVW